MFGSPHEDFKGMKAKNYNFIGQIGVGNFAKVWQAYNESDGEVVAIKAIPDSMLKQKKIKQLALSEIQIMKALSGNPNIVKFIQNFRCSQSVLIVMEHCEGGTLETLLKKQGRFSEEKATNLLKHLLNGFKGLHQKNVIHRDFKAENVLMKNDVPKIADLGFAKMLTHEGGITDTCLGTSVTMAPEVHLGQQYGLKADIWSLGVVYYQLIFGRYPYVGKDDYQILNASKHKPNFIGVNLSPKAKDFILKCLTFKQQERISWRQLYNHPLIRESQKSVYNIGRKQNILKNLSFYQKQNEHQMKLELNQFGSFQDLSQVEKMKLQQADYEKANARNKQKKQMDEALEKYRKIYLNRRNIILFVFKHIDPHIPSILKMPVNHANYVYILCKNAYHDLVSFDKAISTKTNFMKLNPYFEEFIKSPAYNDIAEMVKNQTFVVELQTGEYMKHIKNASQSVQQQASLEKIANKNWPKFVKEVIQEYQNILMDYLDHFKGEGKNSLILVIEALSCLKNLKEDSSMDIFDKHIENIKFQEVEAKIKTRQEALLMQFLQ